MRNTIHASPEVPSAHLEHSLVLVDVNAGYGDRQVLHGVSLSVSQRSVVGLLGQNAAGKSTVLKTAVGLASRRSGKVEIDGVSVSSMSPRLARQHGVVYVPQGGLVFGGLSVLENIQVGAAQFCFRGDGGRPSSIDRVLCQVPRLKPLLKRRAGDLSGGERQMLAIGMAIASSPVILLVDEPTASLDPHAAEDVLQVLMVLHTNSGLGLVIAEHRVRAVMAMANQVVVLKAGQVVCSATGDALESLKLDTNRLRSMMM